MTVGLDGVSMHSEVQEPLLAAIAVCCADEDDLHAMGASAVLEQHAASDADARDIKQSTSGRHPKHSGCCCCGHGPSSLCARLVRY